MAVGRLLELRDTSSGQYKHEGTLIETIKPGLGAYPQDAVTSKLKGAAIVAQTRARMIDGCYQGFIEIIQSGA